MDEVRIIFMGVGGAGNNIVNRLAKKGYSGPLCAINTDLCHLNIIHKKANAIMIGHEIVAGTGASGNHEIGKQCAIMDESVLRGALCGLRSRILKKTSSDISLSLEEAKAKRPDIVFLALGTGGGTGGGAGPEVARIAKELGCTVIAFASTPFAMEKARQTRSEKCLSELRKYCDSVIILDNNRLVSLVPNLPMSEAFGVMDEIILRVVSGIHTSLTKGAMVSLDYSDFLKFFSKNGAYGFVSYAEVAPDETEITSSLSKNMLSGPEFGKPASGLLFFTGQNLTPDGCTKRAGNASGLFSENPWLRWTALTDSSLKNDTAVMIASSEKTIE